MRSAVKLINIVAIVISYLLLSYMVSKLYDYLMINTDLIIAINDVAIVFVNIIIKPIIAGILVSHYVKTGILYNITILLTPLVDAMVKTANDGISLQWIIDNLIQVLIINLIIGLIFLSSFLFSNILLANKRGQPRT